MTVAAVIEQGGRYLLVEEHTADGLRLNTPAGHLEPGDADPALQVARQRAGAAGMGDFRQHPLQRAAGGEAGSMALKASKLPPSSQLFHDRINLACLPILAGMSVLGLLACAVPALLEQAWLRPVPATAVGAVVYYALVPGVLGFWLWFAGSSRVSGAEASLMTALMPVWHWHWPLRCLASASRPRRSPAC